MSIREISFKSFNERDVIKGFIYTPIVQPKACVQVVHGFGEHSRRYIHLIYKLLDEGFVVCADDHVGHGLTAAFNDTWGDFGHKGYMTTTEDENTLRNLVLKDYPNLPYIMFGHSWGSMIARNYASVYGNGMTGLIICGTAAMLPNVPDLAKEMKELIDEGKGSEVKPEFLMRMFAGMVDRYENPKTPNDWIATDQGVVLDHSQDPFNNLNNPPTIQSLYDVGHILQMIEGESWAEKVPKDLPIYNIAGDQDPVGNYGEGVYKVSNWLWNTGHKVTTKVYSNYRHEIHNEPEIREEVESGIIQFINSIIINK